MTKPAKDIFFSRLRLDKQDFIRNPFGIHDTKRFNSMIDDHFLKVLKHLKYL